MDQATKNKAFYRRYLETFSGKEKRREQLEAFVADNRLIEHILFFENLFPKYEIIVDELLAEGDRIFVRSHLKGQHLGETDEIPATQKNVKTPFALGYRIKDDKIVDFWAIANEMELFEQLGLTRIEVEVK